MVDQREYQRGRDMSYGRFESLMDVKFALLRRLHELTPSLKPVLRSSLDAVNAEINSSPSYGIYMERYARTKQKIG